MIRQLSIKNFAIIDDLTIDFENGFNVFTGETGAGKSIIIDALGLLTGERASASMVRFGSTKAFIQGVFELKLPLADSILDYTLGDNVLIITKEIDSSGKSISKINGRLTNIAMIKEITSSIIDIHNQNENLYLLDSRSQGNLLDNFILIDKNKDYQAYQNLYTQYAQLLARKEELANHIFDAEKIEILRHQKVEIEEANIQENEIEALEIERNRIMMHEKIAEKIKIIDDCFESDNGILGAIYTARKTLDSLKNDQLFTDFATQIDEHYFTLKGFYDEFKNTAKSIRYDEDRIEEIQNRIFAINKIKRKYGQSYEMIMESLTKLNNEISAFENREEEKKNIDLSINTIKDQIQSLGEKIHLLRIKGAKDLEKLVKQQMADLSLPSTDFKLIFDRLSFPNQNGLYSTEFYISLNQGVPLKPLAKVISGGEMSRLMLGLKVVFNTFYGISTTIFDEIDAGVSGNVARSVGKKMLQLSKSMQVICITHLPQVASLADVHYYVSKKVLDHKTSTKVSILDDLEKTNEIAKMLSGEKIPSDTAIANAKELILSK